MLMHASVNTFANVAPAPVDGPSVPAVAALAGASRIGALAVLGVPGRALGYDGG